MNAKRSQNLINNIKERLGAEAVQEVMENWSEEDEQIYLYQKKQVKTKDLQYLKKAERQNNLSEMSLKEVVTQTDAKRKCNECNKFSFKVMDDIYMLKYNCCQNCFIKRKEQAELNGVENVRQNNNS